MVTLEMCGMDRDATQLYNGHMIAVRRTCCTALFQSLRNSCCALLAGIFEFRICGVENDEPTDISRLRKMVYKYLHYY